MRPGLVTGFALAFLSCLGSFGVPAMIGIPARYVTLPVLIYQRLSGIGTEVLPQAAALALPLMVLAGITALLASRAVRPDDAAIGATGAVAAVDLGRWRNPAALALMLLATLVLLVPLISLVTASFTTAYGVALRPATFTLSHYAMILNTDEAAHAFLTSLWLAGSTALIAGAGAFIIAVLRWWGGKTLSVLEPLIQAPFALPGTIFAIGIICLFPCVPSHSSARSTARRGSSCSPIFRVSCRWRLVQWALPCRASIRRSTKRRAWTVRRCGRGCAGSHFPWWHLR